MNKNFINYSVLTTNYHNDEISLEKIENIYKDKLDSKIEKIPKIWLATIKEFLLEDEKLFWEKEVSEIVYNKMFELYSVAPDDNTFFERLYSSLEHFFIALSTYDDIINTLSLFKEYSIPNELELRMHHLPTYNSIVEGCLANLFKFLRDNLDLADTKNLLDQTKLDGLANIMRTRDLEVLITDIDIDIRNAINHGGINVHDEKGVTFFYNKRQKGTLSKELSTYDLERKITKLIDCASSIFVGILRFFIEKNVSMDLLKNYTLQENILVYQSLIRLELSTFHKKCLFLTNEYNIHTQNQVSISFQTEELSVRERIEFALLTAFKLYHYFPESQRFFLRFSSERTLPSVIGISTSDIKDFINGEIETLEELVNVIISKETHILWEPSTEEIDIKEAKTAYFSNIKTSNYEITDIKDVSTEEQKRFRVNLFIGEVTRKNHVKKAVRDAINEIKLLKNYPKLQHKIKHGDIPTDAIYITVFKHKARKGRREKHLISNNENFVATVQYNNNPKNKVAHEIEKNGVWKDFVFRQEGDTEYGWNPNF